MRLRPAHAWFLAFAAAFAALAGFVFWGTWGLSACPVMPDARMTFPVEGYVRGVLREWILRGRFAPYDITAFIGSPYLWQELQYAVASFFAALGAAYFLRGRGLSRPASYGAGLLLGFCGYWFTLFSAGHAGWFRWMTYGVFAFALADRAVRKGKPKNWILLGACVAWASFYQPDIWLLFTLFTAVYFVWCCIRERKMPSWKGVLLAGLSFAAIGAPGVMSAAAEKGGRDRQIEDSKGSALSGGTGVDDREARWIFVTNWSLPPAETLEFFVPRINGDTSCPTTLALGGRQGTGVRPYTGALGRPLGAPQGNYRQHSLYVGWVTCLLALFALAAGFRWRDGAAGHAGRVRTDLWFFAAAAVVFWLLSLGRNFAPLYRLVFALPIGDSIRAPVKWHHLTELCLCVLAGYGLDALRAWLSAPGRLRPAAAGLAVAAVALFGACDLARVARFYCAAVDLSVVQAPNPAADEVLRRGGGLVADLIEGGNGLVSWSFGARRVKTTANLGDRDVRFIWLSVEQMNNKGLSAWVKAKKAVLVGTYTLTSKAVRVSDGRSANMALLEVPGVPPPDPPDAGLPAPTLATWLGAVSLLGTVIAGAYGAVKS